MNGNFGGGDGGLFTPYLVEDALDLAELNNYLDTPNIYFRQVNNINLLSWGNWTPIGNEVTGNYFKGNYDGFGHTISNLTINVEASYQGLFGFTETSTIENLTLTGVNISGSYYIGGIVGWSHATDINRCSVTGSLSGISYVGGFIGRGRSAKTNAIGISSCNFSGSISGSGIYTGGIVGELNPVTGIGTANTFRVDNCYTSGSVSGNTQVGGIVGYLSPSGQTFQNRYSYIYRCYSRCTISGTNSVGGIFGESIAVTLNRQIGVRWNFALNPSITRLSGLGVDFGRIYGKVNSGSGSYQIIDNNHALETMQFVSNVG